MYALLTFLWGRVEESSNACVCVYVCLSVLCIEYQNMDFTRKVRTDLGSEAILSGPNNFKALSERLNGPARIHKYFHSLFCTRT